MKTYVLERRQYIHLPRNKVFTFFGDAMNLELITPPILRFRVLTEPPIEMKTGTQLDYKLKLFGIPFHWKTLIESWSPDEGFIDTQLEGPYSLWHHTHIFEEIAPDLTLMRDRVLYQIPFGIFGRLARTLFVKRTLNQIFDYRAKIVASLLAPDHPELDEISELQFRKVKNQHPVKLDLGT